MMKKNLQQAIFLSVVTFVITLPILGISIEQSAFGLTLKGRWLPAIYAAFVVFIAQCFLPQIIARSKTLNKAPKGLMEKTQRYWIASFLGFGLIFPFIASRGMVDVATLALIYVLLGLSLNVVVGYAGLLSLGHVGFYAIGAYTYAILQQFGVGFWTALPIAAFLAAGMGLLLGFPVLRLRGDYLAIVTLGFGEIIRLLINNADSITNGPAGIGSIPAPHLFHLSFTRESVKGSTPFHEFLGVAYSSEYRLIFMYFIILILCLLSFFIIKRLLDMPIGRAWEALREDEFACRSLGINPTQIKLSAFAISAFFAGVAGAFFAAKQGFVNPESFSFIESAIILAIVVLGGMGSQLGVILAAIALTVIPELAREFSQYRMLIFGVVMVLMMLWRPQGLIPAQRKKMELPQ